MLPRPMLLRSMLLRTSTLALGLLACSPLVVRLQAPEVGTTAPPPAEPLEVVVIGASLAGGPDAMLGARATDGSEAFEDLHVYADVLEHLEPTWSLENLGDTWFFTQPEPLGDAQVETAIDLGAELVLALDFPFWYAYGGRDDAARLDYLRTEGLARLERIWEGLDPDERPLVVIGSLPDVRDTPVLSRRQKPSDESLDALNAELVTFAARHPNVLLVRFAEELAELREGTELVVGATTFTAEDIRTLFLSDKLHPSTRGAALVAGMTLEVLAEAGVPITTNVEALDVRVLAEELIRAAKGEVAPERAGASR